MSCMPYVAMGATFMVNNFRAVENNYFVRHHTLQNAAFSTRELERLPILQAEALLRKKCVFCLLLNKCDCNKITIILDFSRSLIKICLLIEVNSQFVCSMYFLC